MSDKEGWSIEIHPMVWVLAVLLIYGVNRISHRYLDLLEKERVERCKEICDVVP